MKAAGAGGDNDPVAAAFTLLRKGHYMIKKTFSRGEMIVREGDLADSMYVIISGSAEVYIGYGTEEERHLTTLDEGSIFGEMAVLEAYPRSATVISGEDGTSLMEISTAEVSEFFREDPSQIRNIMANLSGRLRDLTDEYLEVCGTIREMKETSGEIPRSGSLLSRIEKFLKMAYLVSRTGGTMPEGKEAVQPDENEADGDGLKKIRCSRGRVLFRQGDEAFFEDVLLNRKQAVGRVREPRHVDGLEDPPRPVERVGASGFPARGHQERQHRVGVGDGRFGIVPGGLLAGQA